MKTARNFRDYKVWKDSVDYATEIYKVTDKMPYFEKKGICDQLQRSAVSISSNIAEGAARPSDVDFAHCLDISLGSAYELETQLTISHQIGYIEDNLFDNLMNKVSEIEKQLSGFISVIRKTKKV